ncbi:SHOCT domain-containing protein [Thiomicrorhabdus sp. Kp2]|uniref:SHOCT domain-containing protein n=1 Tax=Thiomicrorhabdus sp. Kp2 TaxID=1123518 RepID=UPI000400907D|nr:SHOCT domain-containing protein [Thiomicrorhabdus sp. Kp2]
MDWHFESMGGYMGGGMWLFWLVVLVVIFVLLRQFTPLSDKETALEVLKKRYAKGEIDKQEFEEKKKDLQS